MRALLGLATFISIQNKQKDIIQNHFKRSYLSSILMVSIGLMFIIVGQRNVLAQENSVYKPAENGIEVACESDEVGDSSEMDGKVYAMRIAAALADLGDYYEARLSYELEFFTYICSCQYDNLEILPGDGYDSEQACLDGQVGEPEEIVEIASCAREVAADASEPPAWAANVTACHIENYRSARQCMQALDAEGDCSQSTLEQVRQCHIMSFGEGEGEDCDAHLQADSPDPEWLMLVQEDIQDQCLN